MECFVYRVLNSNISYVSKQSVWKSMRAETLPSSSLLGQWIGSLRHVQIDEGYLDMGSYIKQKYSTALAKTLSIGSILLQMLTQGRMSITAGGKVPKTGLKQFQKKWPSLISWQSKQEQKTLKTVKVCKIVANITFT